MMEHHYTCQNEDNQSVFYQSIAAQGCGDMFTPNTAGLGLLLDLHQHTQISQQEPAITTNFLDTFFSTAPSVNGIQANSDSPEQWSQGFLASSSVCSQSPWGVTTHYHQTPLLSSPELAISHLHRNSQCDALPGLYSSPGTSVSTRCDTPSSVVSGAEDMKLSTSSMGHTPITPHGDYWAYTTSHSSPSMHEGTLNITTYDTHLALLASTSCSPVNHSTYDASDLDYIKEEIDEAAIHITPPEFSEQDDEKRKIKIMKERTALKRQRLTPLAADGLKPECPQCHKVFSRKHNLRQHQLTSCSLLPQRARDYACGECPKTFHRQTDLQRHKASKHSHLKEFKCEMCEQTFPRKDTLRRHFLNSCKKNKQQNRKDRKKGRRLHASKA